MVLYYQSRSWPQDIMEHIQHLKYYGMEKEARTKLLLVARYVDDPEKLKQFEEQWLYGTDYSYSRSPWNEWGFD